MHPQWLNILSKITIYSNLRVILLKMLSKIDSRKCTHSDPTSWVKLQFTQTHE